MYEITFITKEENDQIVADQIEKLGGKINFKEELGRKKFVYPIKKLVAGFYSTIYFEIEGKKLIDLEKKLLLNKDVIRFLLLKSQKTLKDLRKKPESEKTYQPASKTAVIETPEIIKKEKEISIKKAQAEDKEEVKSEIKEKIKDEVKEKTKKAAPKKAILKKEVKKKPEQEIKKETKETKKIQQEKIKPVEEKPAKKTPEKEVEITEAERLKKLEEKLDELLKD